MCLAIPGQIVSLAEDPPHSALIDVVGAAPPRGCQPGRTGGVGPGDWVLIHVDFAMSKIRNRTRTTNCACSRAGRAGPRWRRCGATARRRRCAPKGAILPMKYAR